MSENCTLLNIDGKEITLIGTAHVSMRSVEEVKQMIEMIHPDSVCIELDQERYNSLNNPKQWQESDIIDVIKKKKVGSLLVNIILSSYQKRMAKKMEVKAGQEMMQAIESANAIDAKIVLIDRNAQITFSRIWRKHSLWQKCKLMTSLIASIFDDDEVSEKDIENLKQTEMLDVALQDVKDQFPVVAEVLIYERDLCLAYNIRHAAGNKIVAVVGAAHVPGIKQAITQVINYKELITVPKKKSMSKVGSWIIPLFILGLIGYGFMQSTSLGMNQILAWILWNGTLSAIGVLLARGHILSILTAFVAAPITSLNPLLAAGWFAGLTEAYLKKPKVKDFQSLAEDVTSIKGFYNNRITHILLVVILANAFSSIGTLVGGFNIIQSLFK